MNTPAYFCIDNVGNFPLITNKIKENKFSIYPNPSSELVSVISYNKNINFTVSIFDIFGKQVSKKFINPNQINISYLPSGQYIMKIESKEDTINEKLLKI